MKSSAKREDEEEAGKEEEAPLPWWCDDATKSPHEEGETRALSMASPPPLSLPLDDPPSPAKAVDPPAMPHDTHLTRVPPLPSSPLHDIRAPLSPSGAGRQEEGPVGGSGAPDKDAAPHPTTTSAAEEEEEEEGEKRVAAMAHVPFFPIARTTSAMPRRTTVRWSAIAATRPASSPSLSFPPPKGEMMMEEEEERGRWGDGHFPSSTSGQEGISSQEDRPREGPFSFFMDPSSSSVEAGGGPSLSSSPPPPLSSVVSPSPPRGVLDAPSRHYRCFAVHGVNGAVRWVTFGPLLRVTPQPSSSPPLPQARGTTSLSFSPEREVGEDERGWERDSEEEEEEEGEGDRRRRVLQGMVSMDIASLRQTLLATIRATEAEKKEAASKNTTHASAVETLPHEGASMMTPSAMVEEEEEEEEREELFVTSFRPRVFRDLLTDDTLNLKLLQWLQSWTPYIFGPRATSAPSRNTSMRGGGGGEKEKKEDDAKEEEEKGTSRSPAAKRKRRRPAEGRTEAPFEKEEDGEGRGDESSEEEEEPEKADEGERQFPLPRTTTRSAEESMTSTSLLPASHAVDRADPFASAAPPEHRLVLLAGPPGCGKTVLVEVLAAHCGYELLEVNASADRTVRSLRTMLEMASARRFCDATPPSGLPSWGGGGGPASPSSSASSWASFTSVEKGKHPKSGADQSTHMSFMDHLRRPKCLLLDEVDGFTPDVVEYLLKQDIRCPIFCIANDVYAPSLRALRARCATTVFHVQPIRPQRLLVRMEEVVELLRIRVQQKLEKKQQKNAAASPSGWKHIGIDPSHRLSSPSSFSGGGGGPLSRAALFFSCIDRAVLSEMVWESDGDIRGCLNSLQFLYLQPLDPSPTAARGISRVGDDRPVEAAMKDAMERSTSARPPVGVVDRKAILAQLERDRPLSYFSAMASYLSKMTRSHAMAQLKKEFGIDYDALWKAGVAGLQAMATAQKAARTTIRSSSSADEEAGAGGGGRGGVVPGFRVDPGFLYLLQRALSGQLAHLRSLLLDGLFEQYLELHALALDYTLQHAHSIAEAFSFQDRLSSAAYGSSHGSHSGGGESLISFADRYAVEGTCQGVYAAVVGSGGRAGHVGASSSSRTGRGISGLQFSRGLQSGGPSSASSAGGRRGLHFPQEDLAFHRRYAECRTVLRSLPDAVRLPYWAAYWCGDERRVVEWCPYVLRCLFPATLVGGEDGGGVGGRRGNSRRWSAMAPVITSRVLDGEEKDTDEAGETILFSPPRTSRLVPPGTPKGAAWEAAPAARGERDGTAFGRRPTTAASSSFSPTSGSRDVPMSFQLALIHAVRRHVTYGFTYRPPLPSSSSPFSSPSESPSWSRFRGGGEGQGGKKRWDRGEDDDGGVESKRRRTDRSDDGGGGEFSSGTPMIAPTMTMTTTTVASPISWVLHPAVEEMAFFPFRSRRGGEEDEREGGEKGGRGGTGAWQAATASASEPRVRSSFKGEMPEEKDGHEGMPPTWSSPFQCPSAALFRVKDDLRQFMVGEIQRWLVVRGRPPALPPRVRRKALEYGRKGGEGTPLSFSLPVVVPRLAVGQEERETAKKRGKVDGVACGTTTGESKTMLPPPLTPLLPPARPLPSIAGDSLSPPLSSPAPLDTTATTAVGVAPSLVPPEAMGAACPPATPLDTPCVTIQKEENTPPTMGAVMSVKDFFGRFVPISKRKEEKKKGTERSKGSGGVFASSPSSSSSSEASPKGGGGPSGANFPLPTASLTTAGGAGMYVKYVFFDGATNAVKMTATFDDF